VLSREPLLLDVASGEEGFTDELRGLVSLALGVALGVRVALKELELGDLRTLFVRLELARKLLSLN